MHVSRGHGASSVLIVRRKLLVEVSAGVRVHVVGGVHAMGVGMTVVGMGLVLVGLLLGMRRHGPPPRTGVPSMAAVVAMIAMASMRRMHRARSGSHIASSRANPPSASRHGLPSRQMTMAHLAGLGVKYTQ